MKRKFSTSWIGSKQPRKQRKYTANAPLHLKHKLLSAQLSKELRAKYSRRSFPVRKGDTVKIMRGKFYGKSGKIGEVDLRNSRVMIEGINRSKRDGTKVMIYFHPSNLQINSLTLDDRERIKSIEKNKQLLEKVGKTDGIKPSEEKNKLKENKQNAH